MKQLEKLGLLVTLLVASLLFFYPAFIFNHWLSPWDFGFLVHSPGNLTNTITGYMRQMHQNSKIYISFVKATQSITGVNSGWIAYPGAIMLIPLIYAYLNRVSSADKILATLVSLGGPLMLYSLFYSLRRDPLNLILIMSFILFVVRIYPRLHKPSILIATAGFSLVIWMSHYTIWPFFIVMAILYPVFVGTGKKQQWSYPRTIRLTLLAAVSGLFPIYVHTSPINIYTYALVFLQRSSVSITNLFQYQRISITPSYIVEPIGKTTQYGWFPEIWYFGAVFVVISLAIITMTSIFNQSESISDVFSQPPELAMLVAASLAFAFWASLLLTQGYFERIFYLWPVMIVILIGAVSHPDISLNMRYDTSTILTGFLVLMVIINIVSVIPAATVDSTPNPETRGSAEFAGEFTPGTLYTGLTRANIVVLKTEHRDLRIPASEKLDNGSIAVNNVGNTFYNKQTLEGCLLVPTSESSIIVWGGTMPASIKNSTPDIGINRVYSSGDDVLSCQSTT